MNKFTASNGYMIIGGAARLEMLNRAGDSRHLLGLYSIEALREFFRAERDEELGRWRYPEDHEWIVYPDGEDQLGNRHVITFWEKNGRRDSVYEDNIPGTVWGVVARAYFEAHPERKPQPWDNAERDEVWLFKSEGNGRALAWRAEDGWDVIDQRGNDHRGIQDVPAEMVEHSFWGWENATAERLTTAAEVSDAVD